MTNREETLHFSNRTAIGDAKKFEETLKTGETIAVEFKRCKDGANDDTYETICSFLNRFGGDIYLGIEDDGTVSGVPRNSVQNFIRNIISMIGNPDIISPTVYLSPVSFEYMEKSVIHIRVPPSSEVHTYKKVIYDRINDSDVKVTATGAISSMYIRKQNIFTEKKVFPHISDEDIRFDLFPKIRKMAVGKYPDHPWKYMSDREIVKSAKLYTKDAETEKWGYNLAAVMLLGTDEIIKSICPAYRTDALLRRINTERYDDRQIVETNLIESYDLLMEFTKKHLLDKFHLEDDRRISLRGIIAREIVVNMLMHREFTSPYIARVIIEKDRMFTENANRAFKIGKITPENLVPIPKNPTIAFFFNNIGYADELGSGTANLYQYVKVYSGKEPQIIEDDIFKTIIPLDDNYSFDMNTRHPNGMINDIPSLTDTESKVYEVICEGTAITRAEISFASRVPDRSVARAIASLIEKELVRRIGNDRSGRWVKK